MIIKAEALPGGRDGVLEDAFNLAWRTGATIEFAFNLETVHVTASWTVSGFRGEALFYNNDGLRVSFERHNTHIKDIPLWRLKPANEQSKAL